MSYPTAPSPLPSSYVMVRQNHHISEVNLGGSYLQRIEIGHGKVPAAWDVQWHYLHDKLNGSFMRFIEEQKGTSLFFLRLKSRTDLHLVYCDYWQLTPVNNGYFHISGRFRGAV